HIRLGGWLGAPPTPLAATWLLPVLEREASEFRRRWAGLPMPQPASVLVHGWYFATGQSVPGDARGIALMIVRLLFHLARNPRRGTIVFMGALSDPATRLCLTEWAQQLVPRQRELIAAGRGLSAMDDYQLRALVAELVSVAGKGFALLSAVCNAAWK